jgi:polysaccharide export outer membrane protein
MRLIALPAVRARRNAAARSADVSVGDAVDGRLNLNAQFMHEIGRPGGVRPLCASAGRPVGARRVRLVDGNRKEATMKASRQKWTYRDAGRTGMAHLGALAAVLLMLVAGHAAGAQSADRLGVGDQVRVTVFQYPDLTTDTRISQTGTITFPLIGEVKIGGLTPAGAGTEIARQLKRGKYMLNPQVTVVMTELRSRQVSVLGQVNRPGRYAIDDTSAKLTDVLALAGGVSPIGADTVSIVLNRHGKTEKLEIDVAAMVRDGDLSKNIDIQNGDTVYVPRAPTFYVYGEVRRAGSYRFEDNMTVMQAISLGGGLTERATERGITVSRRGSNGKPQRIEVGLNDRVQPDDVIYVKEGWF